MTWRTYEKCKNYVLCFGIAFLLGFSGGCLCERESVHHDGNGADSTGVQLEEAERRERNTEAGIDSAKDSADRITEEIGESQDGIRKAESAAGRLEESSARTGDLIEESQSILRGIRERGEEGKTET